MRFRGKEWTGKGVTVAIIDSGIDPADPRLEGAEIEGWRLEFGATGHVLIGQDFTDEAGHGTDIAAAVRSFAPDAKLLAIKIMDARMQTNANLMAAGLETAYRTGDKDINLSMRTPNMGKALLLRDCCAMALEHTANVLAAAHPKNERAYPADLPEVFGVASHRECPLEKFYYFTPHRFPKKEWGMLSGKYLAHGFIPPLPGETEPSWRGHGIATAYLTGRVACLREALPDQDASMVGDVLQHLALTPAPEIGYA